VFTKSPRARGNQVGLAFDAPLLDPPIAEATRLMCLGFDRSAAEAACSAPPITAEARSLISAVFA
jgi:hypothetical protein